MAKVVTILAILILGGFFTFRYLNAPPNSVDLTPQVPTSAPTTPSSNEPEQSVTVLAQDLNIPWDIAFLPSGELLITERPGRLLKLGTTVQAIQQIDGVAHVGEGGLLGLALHPNFSQNFQLYLYLTTRTGSSLTNRIERYTIENDRLTNRQVILENIPGSSNHDGGRLAFGPDNLLYVGTGDAESPDNAQDTNSLAGKILRLNDDGSIPADNPFGNMVYSYGHRNVQGLAWDDSGQLYATEHGPSGSQSGCDELNRIQKGANYGWPTIRCDATQAGMISPILQSGRSSTWAPASAAFHNGSIFFGGLRGQALYEAKLGNNPPELISHLSGEYGRLRTVFAGPDGSLYITTSNRDGRGRVSPNDDKLLKISLDSLSN